MTFSVGLQKHQALAIAIYLGVCLLELLIDGSQRALLAAVVLGAPLLMILGYRWLAFFGKIGFMEFFASDYKSPPPDVAFSFFPWLILLVAALFVLFD